MSGGARRIGKSALVEEFIEQQRVPSVFYTAEIGFGGEPLREFSEAVRISELRQAQVFGEAVPGNWAAALRQLAGVLPGDATDPPTLCSPFSTGCDYVELTSAGHRVEQEDPSVRRHRST